MKLKDIIKTEEQIKETGHRIENNLIEEVNVNAIAHFGNITSFEIYCSNICPMSGRNNIGNLGYVIRAFIELFDLSEEDGLRLTKIKKIPCRLVFKNGFGFGNECIGIGHFMKDKFVLIDDLARLDG